MKYEEVFLEIKYVKQKDVPTPQFLSKNGLTTKKIVTYKLSL